MNPIRSNINKETCSPVSTNCVVWQGPNLDCINVCSGQPLSETMYNLAVEICNIKDQLNLSNLDLRCIIDACSTCPEPSKTLAVVLQLLIDKVCYLQELVDLISTGTNTADELIRVALCFQTTTPEGDKIRDYTITDYVKNIGIEVCNILSSSIPSLQSADVILQDQIDNHETRIDALEASSAPQVTLTCVNPGVQNMDVAIEALEADYCTIKDVLGTAGDLAAGGLTQEPALPVKKLVDPTTDLWVTPSATIGDALDHMWLAIKDLRGAVKTIQDTCCAFNCDDIVIDYDVTVDTSANTLTFTFGLLSKIPNGFYDCDTTLGTKFSITDGNGITRPLYIKIVDDVYSDPTYWVEGYTVTAPTGIDISSGMVITSNVCMTNGSTTCVKCVTVNVPASTGECCQITATAPVTITYKLCF